MYDSEENLKSMAENVAYTFKGLYKTSDWLELNFKVFLICPIILSIGILVFDTILPKIFLDVLAFLSLASTIYLVCNQKEYEKINDYRNLANEFKTIYDELEMKFKSSNISGLKELNEKISELNKRTSELSISRMGRYLSKRVINEEMNLEWLK